MQCGLGLAGMIGASLHRNPQAELRKRWEAGLGETLSTSVPPPGPEVERHGAAGAEPRHFLCFSRRGRRAELGRTGGTLTLSTEFGR